MAKFGPWNIRGMFDVARAFKDLSTGLYRLSNENFIVPFKTWTPEFGAIGGMTFTETGETKAFYAEFFGFVWLYANITGTTSGVADEYIQMSLPLPFEYSPDALSCHVFDGATVDELGLAQTVVTDGEKRLLIGRYDGAVWNLAASRRFTVSGFYRKEVTT